MRKLLFGFLLMGILFACNNSNNSNIWSNDEIRRAMADSLISNHFLGFKLGSSKNEILKRIDSLSKVDDDIRYVTQAIMPITNNSSSSVITIKGESILNFWGKVYFQADSTNVIESDAAYSLSFYNNQLYSININIKDYLDEVNDTLIFDNYISKYGKWYETLNEIEKQDLDYNRIDFGFKDDVVYKSIVKEIDKEILKWSFKNVDILLFQNEKKLSAYYKTTFSEIYSDIIDLMYSSSLIRDETYLGIHLKHAGSREIKEDYIKSYLEDLSNNDVSEWNTRATNVINSTVNESFNYYGTPISYSNYNYMSINYVDKSIHNFIRDSLSNIEQLAEFEQQKQIREKQIRDSLIQDSINKNKKMKLKKQNL